MDVTVVQRSDAFEVRSETMERPPKSEIRLRDLVRLLALRRDVNLPLYTRQASLWPMPLLLADMAPAEWMRQLRVRDLNVWIGDGLFRNTLHNDPYDNFLCQLAGRKHLLLSPPEQAKNLYYARRRDIQART